MCVTASLGTPRVPSCPLESLAPSSIVCWGLCIPSPPVAPEGLLSCWGGCGGLSALQMSDPAVPQLRLVSQPPPGQAAQSKAVAKLELMNELLSLHYLQEGGNIWGKIGRKLALF